MTTIRPLNHRKPDPEQPWRYSCGPCGSFALEYLVGVRGRQARVYCHGCQDSHETVTDRASGRTIPARDV